jgi:hypothetical protein
MEEHNSKSDEAGKSEVRTVVEAVKQRVKLLTARGGTALVEWIKGNEIYRAYVPVKKLVDGEVEEKELKKATPYGENLKADVDTLDPAELEKELNRHGIWTVADVEKNLSMVQGVIMRLANEQAINYLKKLRGKQ